MIHITLATSDVELERCFPVMQELRPQLVAAEFVERVRRQASQSGYQLASLTSNDATDAINDAPIGVKALAGFRLSESLSWGKFLYVDDLITTASARSQGYGELLLEWLFEYARTHQCEQLHLDSGVQRFGAHRFYMRHRLQIVAHHFSVNL